MITVDPPKPRPRIPEWLRLKLPTQNTFAQTRNLLDGLRLHTVCESAKCPNHWECWSKGTATFMIAGDRCTRACGFCAVTTAKPLSLEADEPARVAEATRRMSLKHVVITAVARDDLADGGAEHFRQTIEAVRAVNPGIVMEVLVPDFLDQGLVHRCRPVGESRNLQSQPGDRSTPHAERSLTRNLRPFIVGAAQGEGKAGRCDLHEIRLDAGPRRNRGGTVHRHGRFARCALRHSHAWPISSAHAEALASGGVCFARTIRRLWRASRAKWVLSTSPAARWSAVHIMRMK